MSIKNRNPTVRPDLVLNFARSKTLDPRISFTRTTAGRYWTDAGTQTYAASGEPRFNHNPVTGDSLGLLIEEARTNSATYDSNFDNAVWTKTGVGVNTNVEATLGGYTGGDLVTVLESGGSKSINRTTTPAAGAITFSVFVKAGVSSTVDIGIYQGSWLSLYTFTLSSTGIATLSQGSGTGSITQISTTWYRCEVTAVVTNASMTYSVFPGGINNSVGNSVYLWQAQLEAGYMATSFIPTTLTFTSRSTVGTYVDSTGLIQQAAIDTARNTYNPNNLTLSPVLLIEESRANLLINSNVETDLAAWFTNGSATLVRDTTYPICDTYAVKCTTTTAGSGFFLRLADITPYTISPSTMYTFSVFIYGESGSTALNKRLTISLEWFDANTSLLSIATKYITIKQGIQRVEISAMSPSNAAKTCPTCYVTDYNGTISWWVDAPQLEAGYGATSFIKTTTAAVTRAADVSSAAAVTRNADQVVISGTNFSDWFNPLEGTIVVDFSSFAPNTPGLSKLVYNLGDYNNDHYLAVRPDSITISHYTLVGGTIQAASTLVSITPSNLNRHAFSYKTNSFSYCLNNGTVTADSAGALPTPSYMQIGNVAWGQYLNGHIEKIVYYKKQLSSTEIQSLTANTTAVQAPKTWEKGFFGGGTSTYQVDQATQYNIVDVLTFATEAMSAPSVSLSIARGGHTGVNSSQTGYWAGGSSPGSIKHDEIDGVVFSNGTARNPLAKLSIARNTPTGINSVTSGYFLGGNMLGNGYYDIDGMRFIDESATNPAATLSYLHSAGAGVGSATKGYALGGYNEYLYYNTHRLISGLAYDTHTVFTPAVTLDAAQSTGGGFNSTSTGYHYGGSTGNNPGSTQTNVIRSLAFSTETSSTLAETLDTAASYGGAVNSTSKGYYAGGDVDANNPINIVQDFVFSTGLASTISATLSQSRVCATGVQGSAL